MKIVNEIELMEEGDLCPTCPLQGKGMTKVITDNRGRNYKFVCPTCHNRFTRYGELYVKTRKVLRSMGDCPKCGYAGSLVGVSKLHCHVCGTWFLPNGREIRMR